MTTGRINQVVTFVILRSKAGQQRPSKKRHYSTGSRPPFRAPPALPPPPRPLSFFKHSLLDSLSLWVCRPPLRSSPSFPAPRGVNPDKARRPALPVSRQDCSRDNSSRQCNRLGFSPLCARTPDPRP